VGVISLVASSELVADRLTHNGALRRVPAHGHVQHMTPMLRFHVHVPPEDHGGLQRVAHELGVSAAEVVRRAVKLTIDRHKAARELASVPTHGITKIPSGTAHLFANHVGQLRDVDGDALGLVACEQVGRPTHNFNAARK
jgi:hypothetical protein